MEGTSHMHCSNDYISHVSVVSDMTVAIGVDTLDPFSFRFRLVPVFSSLNLPTDIRGNQNNLIQPIAQTD